MDTLNASLYSIDGYKFIHERNPEILSLGEISSGIYLIEIRDLKTNQRVEDKVWVER